MKESTNARPLRPFSSRAFVAVLILLSGLSLPVTGLANHLLQFEPLTRQRHAWMAAHDSLAILFAVACVYHVVAFNRRAIATHLRGALRRTVAMSREAMLACAVIAVVLFVFVGHTLHHG